MLSRQKYSNQSVKLLLNKYFITNFNLNTHLRKPKYFNETSFSQGFVPS